MNYMISSKPAAFVGTTFFAALYAFACYSNVNILAGAFLKSLVGYFLSWIVVNGDHSLHKR